MQAELELGVGDDDAALEGVGRAELVEGDGRVADVGGEVGAEQAGDAVERDVLVVRAHGRLGRGREDRLGQAAAVDQAGRQLDAADAAAAFVVLAARAGEVAAHDGLDRQRLAASHCHGTPLQVRLGRPVGEGLGVDARGWG